MHDLDVQAIRARFPALDLRLDGVPAAFLDGPAGTQVPVPVIEAIASHLRAGHSNTGGTFATSRASQALLARARAAASDFVGANDPDEIVFGANMTTLTFGLSRALARTWNPGDEIVVTRLDHDANVTPWVLGARDAGAAVRTIGLRREDCTLDLDELLGALGPRTRLVAIGAASNAVGTINPLGEIVRAAHAVDALVFVDAVHLAPHAPLDVAAWGCDFLACSAYKFFGPHVGILWGRRALLERLAAYKLRAAPDTLPDRLTLGTECFELLAGTAAAIDYLADLGRPPADPGSDRRHALRTAFERIGAYERELALRLLRGLRGLPAVRVWGIREESRLAERVPTVAFTHARRRPREVAEHLGRSAIFVWNGNFYALPVTEALGLEPDGLVRVGLVHYNTADEVDRLLDALAGLE